jgi:hypothetical protein
VPFVGRVPVTLMQEIGVPLVRHRDVSAVRSVRVGMGLVHHVAGLRALVRVAVVNAVNVSVMGVVGVLAVRERDVAAVLSVGVLVCGVGDVLQGVWHDGGPLTQVYSVCVD